MGARTRRCGSEGIKTDTCLSDSEMAKSLRGCSVEVGSLRNVLTNSVYDRMEGGDR